MSESNGTRLIWPRTWGLEREYDVSRHRGRAILRGRTHTFQERAVCVAVHGRAGVRHLTR